MTKKQKKDGERERDNATKKSTDNQYLRKRTIESTIQCTHIIHIESAHNTALFPATTTATAAATRAVTRRGMRRRGSRMTAGSIIVSICIGIGWQETGHGQKRATLRLG